MAEGMAREILARIPIPEERAAVLDLICYRALLRMIPKLRGLGVVGMAEFQRRLDLGETNAKKALTWLASLGLARPPGAASPWEIPEAVVETCLRLKEARGQKWWKEVVPPPWKLSAESRAKMVESARRRWARHRAVS